MHNIRLCVFMVNHTQALVFINASENSVNIKSDKLNDIPGGLTFFQLSCEINSVDIDPHIC